MEKTGLLVLYTGDGKGKTTAALGLCIRSAGWGKKICVIQFLKSPDFVCGEQKILEQLGIELHVTGIGFSWTKSEEEQKAALQKAWQLAEEILTSGKYDMVVLDEIVNVFGISSFIVKDIISEKIVLDCLKDCSPYMDVVLTGRNASPELIAAADLVTEMKAVKHPYEKGIAARKGMEY